MKNKFHRSSLAAAILLASALPISTGAANDAMNNARSRQASQEISLQSQFTLSKREAHAAYQDAVSSCKTMKGSERTSCMNEAKANLQQDLAYARSILTSGSSNARSEASQSTADSSSGSSAAGSSSAGHYSVGVFASKLSPAEARQLVQNNSPQARYQRSRREAYAAHQEALAACKSMTGNEKTSCVREAKSNLQNDLAYAKSLIDTEMTTGSGSSSARSGTGAGSAGNEIVK